MIGEALDTTYDILILIYAARDLSVEAGGVRLIRREFLSRERPTRQFNDPMRQFDLRRRSYTDTVHLSSA